MQDNEFVEELSENGNKTGIEAEDEESILEPFDPEGISIEQKVVAMDTLIRRLGQKSIRLAPNFQRNEVWDKTRRSQLIESLMLKIPLPMFYVASSEEGEWEVVDGLQRLSTIRDFILGSEKGERLALENLEFLGEKFNGKTYDVIKSAAESGDLAKQRIMNTIMETEMRFTVINPGTPEEVKRNIFKRINTGGMPLTPQEIRHAMYQGKASDLLVKLVDHNSFISALGKKINDTRMGARELALRFVSFALFPRSSYRPSMDAWLSDAMRVINLMPDLDREKMKKIFKNQPIPEIKCRSVEEVEVKFLLAMDRSKQLFDAHAFRKSSPDDYRRAPINKALFEAWSNILCEFDEIKFKKLLSKKKEVLGGYKKLMSNSAFQDSISRHASQVTRGVDHRYKKINDMLQEFI